MSAPIKPWEANYRNGDLTTLSNDMAGSPFQDRIQSAAGGTAAPVTRTPQPVSAPPQLPPRPSEQTSSLNSRLGYGGGMYGAGGYNSMFGGYGGIGGYSSPLGYGGMYSSPYSSYGGYGGYYNRVGGDLNSSFARYAEESSRPAFESINSIVQVVNSVGMMLDSTFQAVYNSFRAVIGVADNFSRLKTQLIQIFSALAFIRSLKYFFRKVLEILRLRPRGNADLLWSEAVKEAAASVAASPDGSPAKSSWPILLFFGIIMGGPYLIWKLLAAFSGTSDENAWARGEVDHFEAVANFNFQGEGAEELSFSAGQTLKVAPK
ncbi:peroxisomal membrane protein PEX13, partial [Elysia marginata]